MHREVVDSDSEELERLEKSFRAEMEEMVQNLGDLDYLLEQEEEEEDDDLGFISSSHHLLSSKGSSTHASLDREAELPLTRGQTSSTRMALDGTPWHEEEEHNDDTSIAPTGDNHANRIVEEDSSSSLQELRRSLQHAELKLSVRFLSADLEREHQEKQDEDYVNDYGWDYCRERNSSSAAAAIGLSPRTPKKEPRRPSTTSVDDSWGDMRDAFRELERRMATKLEMSGVGVRHHWDQGAPTSTTLTTTTTARRSGGKNNLSGKAWGASSQRRGRRANNAYYY